MVNTTFSNGTIKWVRIAIGVLAAVIVGVTAINELGARKYTDQEVEEHEDFDRERFRVVNGKLDVVGAEMAEQTEQMARQETNQQWIMETLRTGRPAGPIPNDGR